MIRAGKERLSAQKLDWDWAGRRLHGPHVCVGGGTGRRRGATSDMRYEGRPERRRGGGGGGGLGFLKFPEPLSSSSSAAKPPVAL